MNDTLASEERIGRNQWEGQLSGGRYYSFRYDKGIAGLGIGHNLNYACFDPDFTCRAIADVLPWIEQTDYLLVEEFHEVFRYLLHVHPRRDWR